MKKLEIWSKTAHMAAALLVAGAGLMPMTSCEQFDDSELKQQITDINDRLTALETEMDAQLTALKAIVDGKTTILSCLLDEETGMYTITLSDKENTVIEIPAAGNEVVPVISFIEEDGVKYWATVGEGGVKTPITDAKGNKLKLEADIPAIALGEDGGWMVSSDGANWTGLGVNSENAAIFSKVENKENSVIFTLADGIELEVNKYRGDAASFYPLVGTQYFDAGEEKTVEFSLDGIVNIAVQEVPYGWYAKTTKSELTIRAPKADAADADQSGTIKILGVTAEGKSFISEVFVKIGTSNFTFTVNKSDMTVNITSGSGSFIYGAMLIDEFNAQTISDGFANYSAPSYIEANGNVSDKPLADILMSEPKSGYTYVVWAAKYSSNNYGDISVAVSDIESSKPISMLNVSFEAADITYDDMSLVIKVTGADDFVRGCFPVSEGIEPFFETLISTATANEYWDGTNSSAMYEGTLSGLSYGTSLLPDTEYVIYALPIVDGKEIKDYTVDDFYYIEKTTLDIHSGNSITLSVSEPECSVNSIIADITPSIKPYKLYSVWMSKEDYGKFETEEAVIMDILTSVALYENYEKPGTYQLRANNLVSGTEGYILSLALMQNGEYAFLATPANVKARTWSTVTLALGDAEVGANSVAIPYTVSGEISKLVYLNLSETDFNNNGGYQGWEKDVTVMQSYLASLEYVDNYNTYMLEGESLPQDNKLVIQNLSAGVDYVFYMIAVDKDENPTYGVELLYTPGVPADKIIRTTDTEKYEFGKPDVAISNYDASGFISYEVTVTPGNDCKEYYVATLENYLYSDNDWRLAFYNTMSVDNFYKFGPYSETKNVKFEFISETASLCIVWIDSNDMYHETWMQPVSDLGTAGGGESEGGEISEDGSAGDNPRF